jgi:hypothetical protein
MDDAETAEPNMDTSDGDPDDDTDTSLSLRSIRFNVAWNIWREVAECGVFLIPFFLTGEGILAIPLSAVVGFACGATVCMFIYYANKHFKSTVGLTIFTSGLLVLLSTGLFSGGCHNLESVAGSTETVWVIRGTFWSDERLPMTLLKPFGYSSERTLLQMVTFWLWLAFSLVLHYIKYKQCHRKTLPQRHETDKEIKKEDGPYDSNGDDDDSRTRNTEQTPGASTVSRTAEPIYLRNTFGIDVGAVSMTDGVVNSCSKQNSSAAVITDLELGSSTVRTSKDQDLREVEIAL